MKSLVLMSFVLLSATAFADGYRCEGDGYRAKIYNEVNPKLGTRNPAVLIVSDDEDGTLAVVDKDSLTKSRTESSVVYGGETNGKTDGRFVYANLEIEKLPADADDDSGLVDGATATLTLNANHDNVVVPDMTCDHYRKSDRRK